MRPLRLVLAVSVLANIVLAALVLHRRTMVATEATRENAIGSVALKTAPPPAMSALEAALASGDATALAAAGLSPEVIRTLLVGRAFDIFQSRMRNLRPAPRDDRYWRRAPDEYELSRDKRLEAYKAEREFSEAVRTAFGEDLDGLFSDRASRTSFLSPEKRDKLQQIERDYSDMEQQIYADQTGIQLPSDREKLKLLREEKLRDIAALLTPEEKEQSDLRTSSVASIIRDRYGAVLETEEDYKKIFVLQKAFDDRFNNAERNEGGRTTPDAQRARREAEAKLQDDIREALGPERWSEVQKANDQDRRSLASLSRRLNLPAGAADTALAVRESSALESIRINADATLTPDLRKTRLQALAAKAETALQTALGTEGGAAFAQRAGWMNMLKNGQAFSLNAKDAGPGVPANVGTTAYAVPPPKATATPPRD